MGLDHVLSLGEDVNVWCWIRKSTPIRGQSSKATPPPPQWLNLRQRETDSQKDLGRMAITYGYVYVAQIAMGANMNHTIRTILEAESYPGPSLIIAYSPPCINHGIRTGMGTSILQEKKSG